MVSLRLDGITTANPATLQHRCIHSHVGMVMLGGCAQYPHIFGEITLGERCHHAAWTSTGDFQANGFSNCDHLSDPSILSQGPFAFGSLHHHIGSKTPGLEAPLRIQFLQPVERSRSHHVDDGRVEKYKIAGILTQNCNAARYATPASSATLTTSPSISLRKLVWKAPGVSLCYFVFHRSVFIPCSSRHHKSDHRPSCKRKSSPAAYLSQDAATSM
jgi:hypothetical protein